MSKKSNCTYYDVDTGECKAIGAMCTYLRYSDGKCTADHPESYTVCHAYDKDNERCNGTRECDPCNCRGNPNKCDFYPEKRSGSEKDPITVDVLREALKSHPRVTTPDDMIPKWYLFKTEVDLGVRYDQVSILVACTDKEMSDESLYTSKIYEVLDQMYHIEDYRVLDVIQLDPDQMYLIQIEHTDEPAVIHRILN